MKAPTTADPVIRVLRVVAPFVAAAFAVVVGIGLASGTFLDDGRQIFELGWGRITLVDIYLAFSFAALWVFLRETPGRAIVVTIGIIVFGSVVIFGWLGYAAWTSTDRRELVLGSRG